MKKATATFGLHKDGEGKKIWDGNYRSPLAKAKMEYDVATATVRTIQDHWRDYATWFFGSSDSAVGPIEAFNMIKQGHAEKGLTYASTLFSAINSPIGSMPWEKLDMLRELRLVITEVIKYDQSFFTSSSKEAMIGFFNLLEHRLPEAEKNGGYYRSVAAKYVRDVLADPSAPFASRMLTCARASQMMSLPEALRTQSAKEVAELLSDIHADPSKVASLQQDWKTYVRLARMTFSWKHMWFGLKHDKSKDLHVKSYAFRLRYFYK